MQSGKAMKFILETQMLHFHSTILTNINLINQFTVNNITIINNQIKYNCTHIIVLYSFVIYSQYFMNRH